MLIIGALRDILVVHKAPREQSDGLVFGGDAPFQPSNLWRRAQRAWNRAGLQPIGLHEARLHVPLSAHRRRREREGDARGTAQACSRSAFMRRVYTFPSVLIAAGVNAKAITTYMGHASIQATYDLYGKLMPGSEAEAAALVEASLVSAALRGGQHNSRIVL